MIGRVWAVAGVYGAWARANPWSVAVTLGGALCVVVVGLTVQHHDPIGFSPVVVLPFLVQGVLVLQQPALERLPAAPVERWAGSFLAALLGALVPGVLVSALSSRHVDPAVVLALAVLVAGAPLHPRAGQRGMAAVYVVWFAMAMAGVLTTPLGAAAWLLGILALRRLPAAAVTDAVDRGGTGVGGRAGALRASRLAGPLGNLGWAAAAAVAALLALSLLGRWLSGEDPVRDLHDLRGSMQLSWNGTRGLAPALVLGGGPLLGTVLAASLGYAGATGPAAGTAAAARLPVPPRALMLVGLGRATSVWAAGIVGTLLAAWGVAAFGVALPSAWANQLAAAAVFALALVISAQLGRSLAPLLPRTEARISGGLFVGMGILLSLAIPGVLTASYFGGWMVVEVLAATALLSTFAWAAWCVRSVG